MEQGQLDGPSSGSTALAHTLYQQSPESFLRRRHPQDVEVTLLAARGESEGEETGLEVDLFSSAGSLCTAL